MSNIVELRHLKTSELEPNPQQPRLGFDETKLRQLGDSLKAATVLQPIIVRKKGGKYQIVAGERRWRAARLAGIESVPVIVKELADDRVLLESFIENIHREDLTSIERENAVYELWKSKQFSSHRDLAKAVGYDVATVDDIIEAKEFRKRAAGLSRSVPTSLISETQGLDDKTRVKVLEMAERGEIKRPAPQTEIRDVVKVLKEAPAPLRRAFEMGEVKLGPAKEAVQLYEEIRKEGKPIDEKQFQRHVQELKKEGIIAEKQTKLRRELHKEVLTGKKSTTDLKMESAGEDFIAEVKDTVWRVKGWGVPTMMEVGTKHWKEARPYFKQIRDHMDFLLSKSTETKAIEQK